MKTIFVITLLTILGCSKLFSQVSLNADGSQTNPTAIFDIKSSTQGIILPRMTLNERNSINNPAEGLMVFCTNCGRNGIGVLSVYSNGDWYRFNIRKTAAPTAGVNNVIRPRIIWNWNAVPGAIGYKWNTSNSYDFAYDIGAATSKSEICVFRDTTYTRFVWAYDCYGLSEPVVLTQLITN